VRPELKLLLSRVGVNFDDIPYPPSSDTKEVGFINGFAIYFYNYYFVLRGKFPALDAIKVYEEASKSLKIRAHGHGGGVDPRPWLTSDEWKLAMKPMFDELVRRKKTETQEAIDADFEVRRKAAVDEKLEKAYLEIYHIDNSEGMLYMIDYIKNHNIHTIW